VGISLSFLNQLTPYSIILKRNKIILHQQVKSFDSNSFEIIVDRKVKLHAYLFYVFNFSEKFKKIKKYVFLFLVFIKKNVKIKKMVQAYLFFVKLKKINFDIWPDWAKSHKFFRFLPKISPSTTFFFFEMSVGETNCK